MGIADNEDICLSLDEYIRRKKIDGSMPYMDYRKKEKNINKEELDAQIDEMAQARSKKSCKSKFDRYNDSGSDEEDDDNGNDVQMMDMSDDNAVSKENSSIRFYKQMQHPECCQLKRKFKTVEQTLGVKVKSQQWRVQNEESSSYSEDTVNKIKTGRIQKNYKKPVNAGLFVEKGNFTYKFADNPGNSFDDNAESIVGIVRNKPITRIINGNRSYQQNVPNSPVNINMNFKGLFQEMTNCMQTITAKPQPLFEKTIVNNRLDELQVPIAATELFEYLLTKRDAKKKDNQQNATVNGSSWTNDVKDYIISARSGEGIEMNVTPASTNLPLNLRFA